MLNAAIVLSNVLLFSKMFLGLALFTGTAFTISIAWTVIFASIYAFFKGNLTLLKKEEMRFLTKGIQNLNDCSAVFEEAIHNGDVFDENILKNMDQIKRFNRKHDTIKDMLLQKFSSDEMTFQKFSYVLREVENVIYRNMRSILNKISAFDMDEYEKMQHKDSQGDELTAEKLKIYNEYIAFANSATQTNEIILLKLDKMLLEISRYNSLEDGDVKKLPAIVEMDELIKNASLYK
jgi:hypothetical protein